VTDASLERQRKDPDEVSLEEQRRLIGYLGLVLPAGLYALAGIRPTPGLPAWEVLSSVSAYYYSGGVALFAGVLVALSLTLLSYKGYRDVRADRIIGKTSGAAAAGVAFLPTDPPPGLRPGWWMSWMGYAHMTSAIVLFVSFIVFAIWLFRMTAVVNRQRRPADKKARDAVCLACGIIMIFAVLWAGAAGLAHGSIFWPEVAAIEAFAVSWLTKGEAHKPLVAAARRAFRRDGG
jgi:hypothetical protein